MKADVPVGIAAPENYSFLFSPQAQPSALLGLPAKQMEGGGWSLGGLRPSGCTVQPRVVDSLYEKTYTSNVQHGAAVAVSVPWLLKANALYGSDLWVHTSIQNKAVVYGTFHGECKGYFVTAVHVGSGRRGFTQGKNASAEVSVELPRGIGAYASVGSERSKADEMIWDTPQGYAVEISLLNHETSPFSISLEISDALAHGEVFHITLRPSVDAYAVIVFLEEDGGGGVLYPRTPNGTVFIKEGNLAQIGPMTAFLKEGVSSPLREVLVVYAVSAFSLYQKIRPQKEDFEEGAAYGYLEKVSRTLEHVEASKWAMATSGYSVVFKPNGPEASP